MNKADPTPTTMISDKTTPGKKQNPTHVDVLLAVKAMPSLRMKRPAWRLKSCLADQGNICYWCRRSLDRNAESPSDRPRVEHLIRPEAGGRNDTANLVATCLACSSSMRDADPESTTEVDPVRVKRRSSALLNSLNHVMRDEFRSPPCVVAELQTRFENPRFNAFAALTESSGWIAWSSVSGFPDSIAAHSKMVGHDLMSHGTWHAIRIGPEHGTVPLLFLDLVWRLIDLNGFIRQTHLPGHPDRTPTERIHDEICIEMNDWMLTFDDTNDLFRRRKKMKPRWYKGGAPK